MSLSPFRNIYFGEENFGDEKSVKEKFGDNNLDENFGDEKFFDEKSCDENAMEGDLFTGKTTVPASSVATKPILCTESPNYTMLFYYIKMRTSSSPSHPFLQLTGALK